MALKPTINIDEMVSQAALTISGQKKSIAMQRLGTGFRINSAKDDAAGLAISDGMVSQVRGLTQARRNANDGISLAQTAEGALVGTTSQLQRMRELIVAAAAAQNPEENQDLAAIQQEISQNLAEIDRISTQTSFNGIAVLNGTHDSVTFQVGATDGQAVTVPLPKINATTLGVDTLDVSGAPTQDNLARIDSAISQVNTLRVDLGAVENRFVSSQDPAINNTAAALSHIKDADYAAETTAFASASVLQQAGVAVLAQANQQPEHLLLLLPR
jgi:flagellin